MLHGTVLPMPESCPALTGCLMHFVQKGTSHASSMLALNLYWTCRNGTEGLRVGVPELLEELGVLIL